MARERKERERGGEKGKRARGRERGEKFCASGRGFTDLCRQKSRPNTCGKVARKAHQFLRHFSQWKRLSFLGGTNMKMSLLALRSHEDESLSITVG